MKPVVETVAQYLAALPPERRKTLSAVRRVIRANLPAGYRELLQYGMIGYAVPLKRYPAGYLGKPDQPLPYVALGSQKHHMAVYLMNIYGDKAAERWFRDAWKKSGKRLDMGKSCVRFKMLDDLALDVIGAAVARTSVEDHIARYESARGARRGAAVRAG